MRTCLHLKVIMKRLEWIVLRDRVKVKSINLMLQIHTISC